VGKPKDLWSQILDVMEQAFSAGSELALLDAISFCDKEHRPLPSWALTELALRARAQAKGEKIKKKMGRHAFLGQQADLVFEARCFEWVREFREEGHKKERGADAFSRTAAKLHSGDNTVKKAYYRFRSKRPSQRYISLLYLQDDFVGFLQYNSLL
jgi:hypothetical protein